MGFGLETYKERASRLHWDDLDFEAFAERPLDADALRCVRYMHDVEYHTICYLRDLLVTPAHADPEVTAFLSMWAFEELWHGEALGAVLAAHGIADGTAQLADLRTGLGWRDRVRPLLLGLGGWMAGRDVVAVEMAWGALNDSTTQAGYSLLGRKSGHPVLKELLGRIMRQEGRHLDFYTRQATRRLATSGRAQRLARASLRHLWKPVGSGIMATEETRFLLRYLMGDAGGRETARRLDARFDRIPGMGGLGLVTRAVTAAGQPPALASSEAQS